MSASSAIPLRSRLSYERLPAWVMASLPPLGYLTLSVLFFARPVLRDFGSVAIAGDEYDSSAYMWFLAWWPHALLDGVNPFLTNAIFVPEGYNLTWVTSIPGPALVVAPVTLLFGPLVSYNLLAILSPALSAWGAFALCRHLSGAAWPAAIGGYLFGFSPYMLNSLRGAPNLSLVPLLPLLVLLVLKVVEGSLSSRRFVLLMTATVISQFLTSNEMLALALLFGGFAGLLAYGLFSELRAALVKALQLIVIAGAAAVVVLSSYFLFMLSAHTSPTRALPRAYSLELFSFIVPSDLEWQGMFRAAQWKKLGIGYSIGQTSYLGLPLLVVIATFAVHRWRDRSAKLLLLFLLGVVIASFGPKLLVSGKARMPMPWELFVHLPLYTYAIPQRFAVFTFLAVAVIVSMWLARRPGLARWALVLVVVVSFLPNFGSKLWRSTAKDPPLFVGDRYKAYMSPSDHVLTIPTWGSNERWQARTRFGFKIVGGYVGRIPTSYTRYPTWRTTRTGRITPGYARDLRAYVAAKRVTVIVVDKRYPGPWRRLFAPLGVKPLDTGGVLIYRLAPPGGRPALGGSVRAAPTS